MESYEIYYLVDSCMNSLSDDIVLNIMEHHIRMSLIIDRLSI
jgi:hypothetical protein